MKVRRSTSRGSGVTRRGFLRVAAGSAAAGLGVPAVMRAQQPPIRVGHLTPGTEKKGSGPTNLKLLFGNRSPARNTWPQVLEGESKCRDDHDFIFRVVCITSSRGGIAGK